MRYLVLIIVVVLGAGGGVWLANRAGEAPTAASVQAAEDADIAAAMQAFQTYLGLINAFDPAFADSYADNAVVHSTIHYGFGVTSGAMPAAELKANAPMFADLRRQARKQYHYSNLRASRIEQRVRIVGNLRIDSWRTPYPYRVDWMPDSDGVWKIVEEWTDTLATGLD
jgi:hypothetical protein